MASKVFLLALYSCSVIVPASNRRLRSNSTSVGEVAGADTGAGAGCAFAAAGGASLVSEMMSPVFISDGLQRGNARE